MRAAGFVVFLFPARNASLNLFVFLPVDRNGPADRKNYSADIST
jgi:hypothetical protein